MSDFVTWEPRYDTGIPSVDLQHKKLIEFTNALFEACREGRADAGFKSVVKNAVEYVKFHFTDEEEMMKSKGYEEFPSHKAEHDAFTRQVLGQVSDYMEGRPFVANNFVRFLRDWLLSHIAVTDKLMAQKLLKKE
jgi:hemerythrin